MMLLCAGVLTSAVVFQVDLDILVLIAQLVLKFFLGLNKVAYG